MDVAVLVVLFGVTIFVHELGHFVVALKCGMLVDTFSIGFGPPIWKRKYKGILFKLGCIPFGGYVALPQLDPAAMSAVQGKGNGDGEEPRREIPPIAPGKKILVAVAGAVGNIILAFVLAWVIYASPEMTAEPDGSIPLVGYVDLESPAYERGLRVGDKIVSVKGEAVATWHDFSVLSLLAGESDDVDVVVDRAGEQLHLAIPTTKNEMDVYAVEGVEKAFLCVIGDVFPGTAAEEAGLQVGDILVSFDGVRVASSSHFVSLVPERGGRAVPVVVERGGKAVELSVTPRFDPDKNKALVGVSVRSALSMAVMPWMQHRNPWHQVKGDAMGIVRILKALVTPREARQAAKGLGGPVMIIAALWISIKVSILNAVGFLRFLNVNLAILNLLPIPVLDGGHIVFSLWEGITRRRVNPKVANTLVNVFATVLIGLLILLSLRDVLRAPRMLKAFNAARSEDVDGE